MSATKAPTSFVKNEVAITGAFVAWLLTNVGAVIVGHTNLVTAEQWNATATWATPFVSAFLLGVVGIVVRRYVAPAWKLVQRQAASAGAHVPDLSELDPSSPVTDDELRAAVAASSSPGTAHADMNGAA
jgi:hypothetical protein